MKATAVVAFLSVAAFAAGQELKVDCSRCEKTIRQLRNRFEATKALQDTTIEGVYVWCISAVPEDMQSYCNEIKTNRPRVVSEVKSFLSAQNCKKLHLCDLEPTNDPEYHILPIHTGRNPDINGPLPIMPGPFIPQPGQLDNNNGEFHILPIGDTSHPNLNEPEFHILPIPNEPNSEVQGPLPIMPGPIIPQPGQFDFGDLEKSAKKPLLLGNGDDFAFAVEKPPVFEPGQPVIFQDKDSEYHILPIPNQPNSEVPVPLPIMPGPIIPQPGQFDFGDLEKPGKKPPVFEPGQPVTFENKDFAFAVEGDLENSAKKPPVFEPGQPALFQDKDFAFAADGDESSGFAKRGAVGEANARLCQLPVYKHTPLCKTILGGIGLAKRQLVIPQPSPRIQQCMECVNLVASIGAVATADAESLTEDINQVGACSLLVNEQLIADCVSSTSGYADALTTIVRSLSPPQVCVAFHLCPKTYA